MKQVLVKSGGVVVDEVPAPDVTPRGVLVRVRNSCVSVGTEMSGLRASAEPLYRRALKHPENVKKVVRRIRQDGFKATASFVKGKLETGMPTGYSVAGDVIAVGDMVDGFVPGDRVACAGATANHAEIVEVPVNLAVKIPDALGYDFASTVALGAIALQGVRRAQPTMGETIVVVGLGILGQITAQLLRANGCRVIGVDVDVERVRLAMDNGMDHGVDVTVDGYVDRVHSLSDGHGADAVIVTAATESHDVISQAMQACRKKGRVVLVGDVGLNLKRADFYRKELDFLISTSYGPGRYDPVYEEYGQDYPLSYVRWTENRNMSEYLRLLSTGAVSLRGLYHTPFTVDNASVAYDALKSDGRAPLLVLLEYPGPNEAPVRTVSMPAPRAPSAGTIRVALAGAGQYAQAVHLPNLSKLRSQFQVHTVMSRTGATAKAIATQLRAAKASTDYASVLADADVDLVLIATRHHLHARMVLDALHARKHVFVEKPLALTPAELGEIAAFFEATSPSPLLVTGYNRRFSPAMRRAREILSQRTTPLVVNYRMNAGYIPTESWVHGAEGGGRNIGEACHIYDLFTFLTDARVDSVQAMSITPRGPQWKRNDNFVATMRFADGSVCTLTYTAMGHRSHPKEEMEIFADGTVIVLHDYESLRVIGSKTTGWSSSTQDKGQLQELTAVAHALRGGEWPIPLWQQLQTSEISFEVERQINPAAWSTGSDAPAANH